MLQRGEPVTMSKQPESMATEKNKRKNARIPFDQDIVFRAPEVIQGRGIDIGAGGIGVELPVVLEVGTLVEVEIFPGNASVAGEVRWMAPTDGGCRAGIMFSAEDWGVIEAVRSLQGQEG